MEKLGIFLGNRGAAVQSLAQQAAAILATYNASMYLAGVSAKEENTEDIQNNALQDVDGLVGYIGDAASTLKPSNYYLNSEMAGAGVGVVPTGWMIVGTSSGVNVSVVGAGTDSEGGYVDYRMNGTSTATNAFPAINILGTSDRPAAVVGDVWSAAMTIEVIAGTIGSYTPYLQMQEQNSSYTYLTASYGFLSTDTKTRLAVTKLMTHASVAFITANFQMTIPLGQSVDVTFRLRKPQLNKGVLQDYAPTPVGGPLTRTPFIPAYKTTTSQKPVLRGAIVNYCAYNRNMELCATPSALTTLGYTDYPEAGRAGRYSETAAVANHSLQFTGGSALSGMPNSTTVFISAKVKPINLASKGTLVRVQGRTNDGAGYPSARFNLVTGTYVSVSGGALGGSISGPDAEGFYTLTCYYNSGIGSSGNSGFVNFNEGATEAGDTNYTLEIGCVRRGIGTIPPDTIVDNQALPIASSSSGPYHWNFDGVDDRIDIARPTVDFTGNAFRVLAFKLHETAEAVARAIGGAYDTGGARGLQVYIPASSLAVRVTMKDLVPVGPDYGVTRTGNERIVVSGKRTPTGLDYRIRGDLGAPHIQTAAGANANWTPARERIGCYSPSGADGLFSYNDVYGMISGNGDITAGELEILEDFLAALYDIVLVP